MHDACIEQCANRENDNQQAANGHNKKMLRLLIATEVISVNLNNVEVVGY